MSAELESAADELFDAMDPDDLDALLAKFESRSALLGAVVRRAQSVLDTVTRNGEQVTREDHSRLVAATLTWGRKHCGVHARTDHAAEKFRRFLRYPSIPTEVIIGIGRISTGDDQALTLLAHSLRILDEVAATRPVGEGQLILTAVVPAVVATIGDQRTPPVHALVTTAIEVLDRGSGLAAAYRAARRPVPDHGGALPVIGNADFLVRIAGYRLAIEEQRHGPSADALDRLQAMLPDLVTTLRNAATRPAHRWHLWGSNPDEPDVATAFHSFALFLGAASGTDAGRRVRQVYLILNRWLPLQSRRDEVPGGDAVDPTEPGDHPSWWSDVDHVVGWLVVALVQDLDRDQDTPLARRSVLTWLAGHRNLDDARHLSVLLRQLHVARHLLDQVPVSPARRPAGVSPAEWRLVRTRLMERLAGAVGLADIDGATAVAARRITLDALPPLWTAREPVIRLLTGHLRWRIGSKHSGHTKATLVATAGACAPIQFVQRSTRNLPTPCCPDAAAVGQVPGRWREPVRETDVCRHRPWGEIGWVDTYGSLGEASGCSAEAARKQVLRYDGPWPELLLALMPYEPPPESSSRRRWSWSSSS